MTGRTPPQTTEEKITRLREMYEEGSLDFYEYWKGTIAAYMGLKPIEYICGGVQIPDDSNVVRVDFKTKRRS